MTAVEVGFGGSVKVGRWAPVRIQLAGAPDQTVETQVLAADPDGDTVAWSLPSVTIGPSGSATAEGVFQIGRMNRGIRVVVNGQTTFIPPAKLQADRQSTRYIGVIGECSGFATAVHGGEDSEPLLPDGRIIKFDAAERIPTSLLALDAIDLLVVAPSIALPAEQSRAIEEWVLAGGHLVIGLDDEVDEFRSTALAQWIPIDAVEPVELIELRPVSDAVPRSVPLLYRGGVRGARISGVTAETLIGSLGGPVALRAACGFGRVTVFGLDWTQNALRQWSGMPALATLLADLAPAGDTNLGGMAAQLRPTGVSDLSTQLVGQLDQFSEVDRPSYWSVLGYIMLFLLVAGPLDYWLVRKVLNRPQLTWYTLPAWVAIASLGGTVIAGRSNPDRQLVNQMDFVDIDTETGFIRARSWMTVYSPEPRRHGLRSSAPDWLSGDPAQLSWLGVPETGFRGMYRQSGLDLASREYAVSPRMDEIQLVPVDSASSKSFTAVSTLRDDGIVAGLIEADLQADSRGQLTSTSTLTHRFPAALTDWCLMYRSVAYIPRAGQTVALPPAIPPGLPFRPKEDARSRTIDRFLKNVRNIQIENPDSRKGQETTPDQDDYDPLGRSPVLLARTLTFHQAAGGGAYTTLDNEPLERYDLTDLLKLDRAVLFARVDAPATTYDIDGQTVEPRQAATFLRIVLPVRPPDGADASSALGAPFLD